MSHFIRNFVPPLVNPKFKRLFVVQLSSLQVEEANTDSFAVNYFINKCGLAIEEAISASKYVNFDKPDKPDACLAFFKNLGFTDTQLSELLTKFPRIIVCHPERTLLPKIQFFHSKGFLETDIPALVLAEPRFFVTSLEGQLIPTFNLLNDQLGSVEITVETIKSYPRILCRYRSLDLHLNIQLLKAAGMPSNSVASVLRANPLFFACSRDKMKDMVKDFKKMGSDPKSWEFITGVCSTGSLRELAWNSKLEAYRKWGCSKEEVIMACKRGPSCMKVSEEKIDLVMDFFVNEMGWTPQMLLLRPKLLLYSLQKRIVPRCSVYKLLLSKALLKVDHSFYKFFNYPEDEFLEKFINCYLEEAPELFRLYEEKMQNSMNRYHSDDEFLEKFVNRHPEEADTDSFTVKYFIHKCGLARDNAVSASKYVNFDTNDKPDASLAFFKNLGSTDTQLSDMLTKYPRIIACHPEKTLLPKIQFLHSMGFLETDIPALLVAEPDIFLRSLKGHLVPTFNFLNDHLGDVSITLKTIKFYPRILSYYPSLNLRRNIQLLKEAGMPSSSIASCLSAQPLVFACPFDRMKEMVKDIKKMGSDAKSWEFISGVCSIGSLTELAWNNKCEVYRKWGCSKEEVLTAFKRDPRCMKVSEEKIDLLMDFFVNEMGWTAQMLLLRRKLLLYSFQKRIVPRCSVYKLLVLKGLLKGKSSMYTFVKYPEDEFLEKFINCYLEEAPELFRLYEEKMQNSMNRYNSDDEFLEKFVNRHPEEADTDSFTVKYLIDKCGLSRDKAVSASKYVNFDINDKPDASLAFFKNLGFIDTQLSNMLTKCPRIIACNPEKTLLPKIQFLHSKGFRETDIPDLLVAEPNTFLRSLKGHLEPTFNLLNDHLGCVEITMKTIKSYPKILSYYHTRALHSNIQLLKEAGVPSSCIASGLRVQPLAFACSLHKMQQVVKDVKKMGSWKFITGVCSIGSLSELALKNKLEVFQKWDCSKEEVLRAFKREPKCMKVSEEKIDLLMEFFVNEMEWTPQMLLLRPNLFLYSLQKRIVPRCSVYKLLLSKGLLKVKGSIYTLLKYPEDEFLVKLVNYYPEEAPELLRLYEEKMQNSMNRYDSEDEFLGKFINCSPEEAPELLKLYEEKIKNSMNRYKT